MIRSGRVDNGLDLMCNLYVDIVSPAIVRMCDVVTFGVGLDKVVSYQSLETLRKV
jgi:hypothetical protein